MLEAAVLEALVEVDWAVVETAELELALEELAVVMVVGVDWVEVEVMVVVEVVETVVVEVEEVLVLEAEVEEATALAPVTVKRGEKL